MKFVCVHCGGLNEYHAAGRAAKQVTFSMLCEAIKYTHRKNGKHNGAEAGRYITRKTKVHVSDSFVTQRLIREAAARGIKRETLLAGILSGQVTGEPVKKYQG